MEITTDMSQRASFDHDIPRAGKHCGQIGRVKKEMDQSVYHSVITAQVKG